MGKYMRKPKITPEVVSLMEVAAEAADGVRTRAKTLALQRLQRRPPSTAVSPSLDRSSSSYLQLRSRTLRRKPDSSSAHLASDAAKKGERSAREEADGGREAECVCVRDAITMVDASFSGENDVEVEGSGDRSLRESTPCSLVRDFSSKTPQGSGTRQQSSWTAQSSQINTLKSIPTADEIEQFFACVEQQQQRSFMEKYNYDIFEDHPLPGNFEWVAVTP